MKLLLHSILSRCTAIVFVICSCYTNGNAQTASETISSLLETSIRDGAFPGAVAAVIRDGRVLYHKAFGRFMYDAASNVMDTSSIFDMASLTKVLCTTSCIMKLYEEGKISLDAKVSTYIPAFAVRGKQDVTVRHLLLHNAGFAAFRPVPKEMTTTDEFIRYVINDTLRYKPGDSTIYSDLSFITLGYLVRVVTGKRLDQYFAEQFAAPLGMRSTMFNPAKEVLSRVAPTETDTLWVWKKNRALVHDPRAAFTDGVSGHAGLFSTTGDVIKIMTMFMNGGEYGGKRFLKAATIQLFTQRASERATRALGWDTKSEKGSSAGTLFSAGSFGHTGFTGTSVWVDPVRKICAILLTNRVYPTSENRKIIQVRPKFADAVIEFFGK